MLTQIPHDLYLKEMEKLNVMLPSPGSYGVGMFFFPRGNKYNAQIKKLIKNLSEEQGTSLIGWRDVPVNNECLSKDKEIRDPSLSMCRVF